MGEVQDVGNAVAALRSPGSTAQVTAIALPPGRRGETMPLRGRGDVLAELADAGPPVRVLHGPGGCGKTRLALEVASRARERGTGVWWVSAAEETVLASDMRAVARDLGVTDRELQHADASDVIWQRLARRQDPWLLVIDGADDPRMLAGRGTCVGDGLGWLRPLPGEAGMVLITSRDGRAADWGSWCGLHRLGMLPAGEAAIVLADHAGREAGVGSHDDARMLALRLGGLPLALKIAGSYLATSAAMPPASGNADVIRAYRQYADTIAGSDPAALSRPAGEDLTGEDCRVLIGWTSDLTLGLLDAGQIPEARGILRLLATFAGTPVPHELLLSPAVLAAGLLFGGITESRLQRVLHALDDCGLIELGTAGEAPGAIPVARLHPLVCETARRGTGPNERMALLELAARLLKRAAAAGETRLPAGPSMWPAWQLLAPHAVHVFDCLLASQDCADDAAEAAAYAADIAAAYQATQGLHAQAEARFRDVLAVRMRLLGPDHPDTLATRLSLARETAARGDHAAAQAEFRDVLFARLRTRDADEPETLASPQTDAQETAAQETAAQETAAQDSAGQDSGAPAGQDSAGQDSGAPAGHAGTEAGFRDARTGRQWLPSRLLPGSRRARKVIMVAAGALVLIIVGTGLVSYLTANHYLSSMKRIHDPFLSIPSSDRPPRATGAAAGDVTFLVGGIDTGSMTPVTGGQAAGALRGRTNPLMLVHLLARQRGAYVVTIPRDAWVRIPGYGKTTISSAYLLGGPTLAVRTVEQLTHVRIDHVAVVDWAGFRAVTDSLGGVNIDIPVSSYDPAHNITWTAGVHHLNGEQALLYVRDRQGLPNGSTGQERREQYFLRAVFEQLRRDGKLTNPLQTISALTALSKAVSVDNTLSNGAITSLAMNWRGLNLSSVVFATAPYTGARTGGDQSVVLLNPSIGPGFWHAFEYDSLPVFMQAHNLQRLGGSTP